MKKITKIFLISALVCLTLGIGMLIGGVALGGTWQGLRESIDNGDYCFGGFDNIRIKSDIAFTSKETHGLYQNVQKIEVEMKSGGLYFEPTNDSKLSVAVKGSNGKETTVRQNGNELKIYNNFRNHKGSVTVYYPENMEFQGLDIYMGGGETAIEGTMKVREMDVELGAGVFHAEQIQAAQSSWKVGVGEIVLGRIQSQKMDFDCGTGSLEAQIAGKQDEFNYKVECGIGSVTIGQEEYGGVAFEKKVSNGKASEIDISCGIGAVTLSFD